MASRTMPGASSRRDAPGAFLRLPAKLARNSMSATRTSVECAGLTGLLRKTLAVPGTAPTPTSAIFAIFGVLSNLTFLSTTKPTARFLTSDARTVDSFSAADMRSTNTSTKLQPALADPIATIAVGLSVVHTNSASMDATALGLMLAPKAEVSATDAAGSAKKARTQTKQDNRRAAGNDELVETLAKLSLQTSRRCALSMSILMTTVTFSKQTDLGKAIAEKTKATTSAYSQQVRGLGAHEKAAYGSPHIFVWLELVAACVKFGKEDGSAPNLVKDLEMHQADLKEKQKAVHATMVMGADPALALKEVVADLVKTVIISKCYDPQMAKMELNCTPGSSADEAGKAIVKMLQSKASGQIRRGQPPRNDLERKLAKYLDARNE
eukprot:TRINITY_DN40875_c0_g1_i1.p2 TRINITY_DN40875_c0_g1~~TRINITY_DN40875_c0_g1_i1.p2  ORF type:complete len:381 (+),score=73.92 TRINITY_DN40875_c0_g1_i1:288-1430(+)